MAKKYDYDAFLKIIAILRSENGCPWDREQTHESLKVHLIEECYELVEAIEKTDSKLMQEELGDVLLQVVMHAQIAKEEGCFTMEDVVQTVAEKMVKRHPHVFKTENSGECQDVKDAQDVMINWEKIKSQEKKEKSVADSMDRVAKTLPTLMRTQKVQKKALKFDKKEVNSIEKIDTIISGLECLKYKDLQQEHSAIEEEIGKIMFEVVNLTTFFDINAEFTLTKSLEKFINRFRYIENSRFSED